MFIIYRRAVASLSFGLIQQRVRLAHQPVERVAHPLTRCGVIAKPDTDAKRDAFPFAHAPDFAFLAAPQALNIIVMAQKNKTTRASLPGM